MSLDDPYSWLSQPKRRRVLSEEKSLLNQHCQSLNIQEFAMLGKSYQQSSTDEIIATSKHLLCIDAPYLYTLDADICSCHVDELPLPAQSVSFIYLPHSLELATDPFDLLTQACESVKPEGYLFLFQFNPISLPAMLSKKTQWTSKKQLIQILHKNHFNILSKKSYGYYFSDHLSLSLAQSMCSNFLPLCNVGYCLFAQKKIKQPLPIALNFKKHKIHKTMRNRINQTFAGNQHNER